MDVSALTSNLTAAAQNSDKSAAADSMTKSLQNISSDSSEEELKGVIKDFESYFVEQMLKEVKKSLETDEESSTVSQYKDMYMDQVIETVADQLVDEVGENFTQQLYEQMNNKVKEQEKLIKKNQLELKATLQDLVDTEKYLTIIEDRNREIQKQKEAGREKKEILREKNIYANRQTEIKVNTEYLEKMGYSIDEGTEEPAEQTTVDEKPAKQEIEIHINPDYQKKAEEYKQDPDLSAQLDAEYFKAQAEKEARASKETKEITEGIHKMWRSLVNKD